MVMERRNNVRTIIRDDDMMMISPQPIQTDAYLIIITLQKQDIQKTPRPTFLHFTTHVNVFYTSWLAVVTTCHPKRQSLNPERHRTLSGSWAPASISADCRWSVIDPYWLWRRDAWQVHSISQRTMKLRAADYQTEQGQTSIVDFDNLGYRWWRGNAAGWAEFIC